MAIVSLPDARPVVTTLPGTTNSTDTVAAIHARATLRPLIFVTVSKLADAHARRLGHMTAIGTRHVSYDSQPARWPALVTSS
jgi:hypothetical protein